MPEVDSHHAALVSYGMQVVADVFIESDVFNVRVNNQGIANSECCIYAFLVGNRIVRIGSSKGVLRTRLRAWQNDVSRALQGRKSPTKQAEADQWRALFAQHRRGLVFARPGTVVDTPVGTISTYLNEECTLIERYRPEINRSWC